MNLESAGIKTFESINLSIYSTIYHHIYTAYFLSVFTIFSLFSYSVFILIPHFIVLCLDLRLPPLYRFSLGVCSYILSCAGVKRKTDERITAR